VIRASQAAYCLASFQLTLMMGIPPRPQRSEAGGHTPAAAQASHSSNVASNFETAIGLAIETSCLGRSLARASGSSLGEPMLNRPAGITTIAGQFAQSLNSAPGLSASALPCPAAGASGNHAASATARAAPRRTQASTLIGGSAALSATPFAVDLLRDSRRRREPCQGVSPP
jgi:hypothetical protein